MKSFEGRGPGPVPKVLLWASVLILAGTAVVLLVGGHRVGVTWDEPYHVERTRNYLDHGWYVIDAQSENGKPFAWVTDQYVYGPATMMFLHWWNVIFGAESGGVISASGHAYQMRHIAVSLLGMIGLLGIATLGRLVLRRWDWGVVAAASLCAVPMWVGHAMFNMKDVPVATGYVWMTVGLTLAVREGSGSWRRSAATIISLAAGTYLALGTRPGMWSAAVAGTVAFLILLVWRRQKEPGAPGSLRRYGRPLAEVAAGYVIAYAGLIALYPKVFAHPLKTAHESAAASANFLGISTTRAFLPGHLLVQVPLMFQVLTWLGVGAAILGVLRHFRRPLTVHARLMLIGVQLLALPGFTLLHGAGLYGDLRHLLFAAAAAAVFVAFGMATLVERARARVDRVPVMVPAVICALAVALPVVDQLSLFPYNYTYYNINSRAVDLSASYDYYRASPRALLDEIPPEGRVVCSPVRPVEGAETRVSHLDGARDCRTAITSPIAAFADEARGDQPALQRDEFWAILTLSDAEPPPNCRKITTVRRNHYGESIGMSALARCTSIVMPLSLWPVTFPIGVAPSWNLIDEGWYLPAFSPHQRGFRTVPSGGSLQFRLPASARTRLVALRTDGALDPASIAAEYDGRPVQVRARAGAPDNLLVALPPGPAGEHRLWLRPQEGKKLSLTLLSVWLDLDPRA